MKVAADTSLLCALYREQGHSKIADHWMANLTGPLRVSSFLVLEFKQSIRLQVWLNANDRTKGYANYEATAMLREFQADLERGIFEMAAPDWADVHKIADSISGKYSESGGHRLADIMHVATAVYFGAERFFTFDVRQKRLAEAEGMTVPL